MESRLLAQSMLSFLGNITKTDLPEIETSPPEIAPDKQITQNK